MVENPGKKASAGRIRPLNPPVPIEVTETGANVPASIRVGRRELRVSEVLDTWDLEEEWWRTSPIDRRYYEAILEDGRSIVVFRDVTDGSWYRQHVRRTPLP